MADGGAAQVEEVVVNAHGFLIEQTCPDLAQAFLGEGTGNPRALFTHDCVGVG